MASFARVKTHGHTWAVFYAAFNGIIMITACPSINSLCAGQLRISLCPGAFEMFFCNVNILCDAAMSMHVEQPIYFRGCCLPVQP
jgi:hypothetical protein